jgi:AsmA protein
MQKRWLKIAGIVIGVIVLVLILVPLFVNGETFRPTVESQLSSALGRKITLGHLSFSLLSGSLVAQDIAIADDPAFSASPFIRAQQLKVGVEVMPLIFSRQVHITRLTIDTPAIQLIQNQAGKWNYSSIGAASPSKSPQPAGSPANTKPRSTSSAAGSPPSNSSSSVPDLTVGELKITNGSASLSSVPPTVRPFVYSHLDVTVKNFSFTTNFPFNVSAKLPGDGQLKLNGTAGPVSATDTSETPFQANIQITHLDPVAAGLIEPGKGISGIVDVDSQFNSNGATLSGTGKVNAAKLQLSRTGSPAPQPVAIDFNVSNDLRARTGRVSDIAIHAGSATAHVTGTYRFTPQAVVLDLHLAAPNLPVDQLEKFLPAFGVQIPSGSQLKGGTLTANLNVTGPATATTIAGPADIENTQLAGFDLGSKIQGLSNITGTKGGTQIQTLRATINSTPQTTQISNIDANLPQLGTATGSGTVAPSGALDFKVVATLNSNNMVGSLANQAVNQATGFLGGFLNGGKKPAAKSNTAHGIPLHITGTASSPTIRADIAGMFK